MVDLFTDKGYRQELLKTMSSREFPAWDAFHKAAEVRQNQIAAPVLNRLDIITGHGYLADCLDSFQGIDFVELIDKGAGKAIILDLPKGGLGVEGVDVIAALIATKLDVAVVLRKTSHPVFIIQDEPRQYLRSARTWKSATVESRKHRFSYCWMFHSWEQIPSQLAEIIKAAGPRYPIYSSSKRAYRELAEELMPFTLEECLETRTHHALNIIRSNGLKVSTFMAKMAPPAQLEVTITAQASGLRR